MKALNIQIFNKGSRDGVVMRALAPHQCGPGSIPGPDAISGLTFCWFSSLPRRLFSGFSDFPPSTNQLISCAPRSRMDRMAAARGVIVSFRFDLVELRRCCTLRRRENLFIFLI